MFGARERLARSGASRDSAPVAESELYQSGEAEPGP
jgi:hypothetical protein